MSFTQGAAPNANAVQFAIKEKDKFFSMLIRRHGLHLIATNSTETFLNNREEENIAIILESIHQDTIQVDIENHGGGIVDQHQIVPVIIFGHGNRCAELSVTQIESKITCIIHINTDHRASASAVTINSEHLLPRSSGFSSLEPEINGHTRVVRVNLNGFCAEDGSGVTSKLKRVIVSRILGSKLSGRSRV